MASLNYNHLRYFRAVARNGNLTRTAEQLHLSQSALSLQIRKLEDRLGLALFERRGKQLHLTDVGRIALEYADRIFAAGDELLSTLAQCGSSITALRVGSIATLSRNFQLQFLAPLLGCPEVRVTLRSGSVEQLLELLASHRLDVVLTNRAPPRTAQTPWIVHRLDDQQVGLVGAPEFAMGGEPIERLLETLPLIVPTPESAVREAFDALVERAAITPTIVAEVDDMAMMRLLARAGHGVAVIPPIVARDELDSGQLVNLAMLAHVSESFCAVTVVREFANPLLRELLAMPAAVQ